ncbi:hypothetical protein MMU07_21125 [Aquiflexum sp. LQ15W]|uniref:hypothetical protein n=1 Tax=Cognataquiflexum nitidum TaxID=2922272 RepID=UPI001F136643|nr:hypothetical protein [Cognataquiflexum nitidum]MCH6202093.1 hypothetical protein [Cognataquiflexum nitidum]
MLQVLCVYHFLFAIVFHHYLLKNGGDAIRYWDLTADLSQKASTWGEYWGRGTFFLQWFNFLPSKVFGLGFLFGNVLYAFISFFGIREIYLVAVKYWPVSSPKWIEMGWLGLFFLPNLHFWSAGVGKEAFLILGLGVAIRGFSDWPRHWILVIIGTLLSFWVRPVAGLALGLVVWAAILLHKEISVPYKAGLSLLVLVAGIVAVQRIYVAMHLEEYSFSALRAFSAGQMSFLREFGAGSEVDMEGYSWGEKLWTVFFRPFWTDIRDFWDVASVMENSFALLLFIGFVIGTVYSWFTKKVNSVPYVFYLGIALTILMGIVFTLTLNNLGIMMRMKSTYMLLCYLGAWRVFYSVNKSYNCIR